LMATSNAWWFSGCTSTNASSRIMASF